MLRVQTSLLPNRKLLAHISGMCVITLSPVKVTFVRCTFPDSEISNCITELDGNVAHLLIPIFKNG